MVDVDNDLGRGNRVRIRLRAGGTRGRASGHIVEIPVTLNVLTDRAGWQPVNETLITATTKRGPAWDLAAIEKRIPTPAEEAFLIVS